MNILIFDFDGTVVDSKKAYYSVLVKELGKFGFGKDDVTKAIDKGLSLRKTLGHLGLNFLVRIYLHWRIMRHVRGYIKEIRRCKNVGAIAKLSGKKILVTNSVDDFAFRVMKHLKMGKYFSETYGADDFSDKAEFIRAYLKKNKISRKDCYYVGDRVADVKVARECGCHSVIISNKCSWDSRKEVLKAGPDFIIDNLGDLKKIVG